MPRPQQIAVCEQCTRVLQVLALRAPLVLVLDDLQWADGAFRDMLYRQAGGHPLFTIEL